ncbi:hypothetical protein HZC21_02670 [Candidatus Peregrinibacteria bacterium]|nr:hypothetical protein [Candidatus Peregrinibacteria bacterium]
MSCTIPEGHKSLAETSTAPKIDSAISGIRQRALSFIRDEDHSDYLNATVTSIQFFTKGKVIAFARAARSIGDFEATEIFEREVLRRNPDNIPALRGLAVALEGRGKFQEACEIRQEIVHLKPNDVLNKSQLETLELKLEERSNKESPYRRLKNTNPADCTDGVLKYVTEAAGRRMDYQAMLRFAEEFLRRNETAAFGYAYTAIALECLGRIQEAIDLREMAEKIIPEKQFIEINRKHLARLYEKLRAGT